MIVTFLRASFERIPSKNIVCRYCKYFNQNEFPHELDLEMSNGKFYSIDDFSNLWKKITDKHVPIKEKEVTDISAPRYRLNDHNSKHIWDSSVYPNPSCERSV